MTEQDRATAQEIVRQWYARRTSGDALVPLIAAAIAAARAEAAHKADQYDTVVAWLKPADGGHYRNDVISAIQARIDAARAEGREQAAEVAKGLDESHPCPKGQKAMICPDCRTKCGVCPQCGGALCVSCYQGYEMNAHPTLCFHCQHEADMEWLRALPDLPGQKMPIRRTWPKPPSAH